MSHHDRLSLLQHRRAKERSWREHEYRGHRTLYQTPGAARPARSVSPPAASPPRARNASPTKALSSPAAAPGAFTKGRKAGGDSWGVSAVAMQMHHPQHLPDLGEVVGEGGLPGWPQGGGEAGGGDLSTWTEGSREGSPVDMGPVADDGVSFLTQRAAFHTLHPPLEGEEVGPGTPPPYGDGSRGGEDVLREVENVAPRGKKQKPPSVDMTRKHTPGSSVGGWSVPQTPSGVKWTAPPTPLEQKVLKKAPMATVLGGDFLMIGMAGVTPDAYAPISLLPSHADGRAA